MEIVFYIEIGGGANGGRRGGIADLLSYGEREHALSFARQIQKHGYSPRFVVAPRIANHIRLAGFEPDVFALPEIGVKLVNEIDPAMVIGCEFFNLSAESATGLIQGGRTIGTLDGTSLAVEINTDPLQTPKYKRSLVLPDHYYAFRPCPVNDAAPNTDTIFHWSLFPEISRAPKDERLYAYLDLDPSRKTVMFSAAPWAMMCAVASGLESYYQSLVSRIVDGLDAARERIDFVFVSPYRPASMTIEQKGDVTVHYTGLLQYDAYDGLLASCDAIITDNVIQTSVSKAIVMGIPHLIIQNSVPSTIPYAYNMFPLKLLFPVEREYAQIAETAEFDDPGGICERLVAILRNGYYSRSARERRCEYVARLSSLVKPGEILENILGPGGVPAAAASETLARGFQ